ncbi:NrfD/PsrC family molybdoenzyme membrane anchor subunit [Gordonibacter massiliensis (ex Traore et al. 2017)]|uniref:Polysulfide reductase NrfD n=1 Tax=Gordonibacter massiliensis (ex Traore et al. 2017) TaxID=1841863 RepID=A0A842JH89_9ACTN|nr:NrfD/PsrC family molybdoenzyme membrane anchor subunit [Gordonibacter massiliensis (ex Traore et al. 2017)]MBC2889851.1 polysulfide reductase NrfD [Gordonibacter massiliensis (ex Traore et al. 2017)]
MGTSRKFKVVAGVLGALTVAGIAAWIYQLMNGLGVTGMNNGTSWGLYITCFMFFVGLSAGGLIVASSASVFHVAEYKKVALPAVILSTVCICCAGMFVLIDLGGIGRVWRIVTGPNPTSPLFWDICVITLYLVINVVYLYFMKSKKPGAQGKVAIVSRFALPVAILVHSVTAWIFGLEMAREGWYSAIMAPLFVVSAMDSGLALLLLSLMGLNKSGAFKVEKKLISNLAGLLAACIAVDGFFVGCEALTMAYPGAAGAETLAIMATGVTAPFFWFEIIVGVLIPFCILVFARNRARMGLVAAASVCVVMGVFFKRVWLLLTSFVVPNVAGAPGIMSGSSSAAHAGGVDVWAITSSYVPTWVEITVAVGVVSLGVLAFMLLSKKLLSKAPQPVSAGETAEGGIAAKAV